MAGKPPLQAALDLFGQAVETREGRPGRLSGAPKKTPTVEHRCELCPKVGSFGFGPPREFRPAPGTVKHYCGGHRAAGEAAWRELYNVKG